MKNQRGGIPRRDALRVLGSIPAVLAAAGVPAPAVAQPVAQPQAKPAGKAAYVPKFFNAHEWKTANLLADMIIPKDEHSGSASEAGAVDYIDELAAYKGEGLQTELRGGLMWLDHECNARFGKSFLDSSAGQRTEILDLVAYPEKQKPGFTQAVDFFNLFRDLTASGFYTSKMGIADLGYLGNDAYDWEGCPSEVLHKLGL